jgi:hypothetical protein
LIHSFEDFFCQLDAYVDFVGADRTVCLRFDVGCIIPKKTQVIQGDKKLLRQYYGCLKGADSVFERVTRRFLFLAKFFERAANHNCSCDMKSFGATREGFHECFHYWSWNPLRVKVNPLWWVGAKDLTGTAIDAENVRLAGRIGTHSLPKKDSGRYVNVRDILQRLKCSYVSTSGASYRNAKIATGSQVS